MCKVTFYENVQDELLTFAVIISRYEGKWVYCKQKQKSTYECPGGRREKNEEIDQTARRELYEETGAKAYTMTPVCCYSLKQIDEQENVVEERFGKLFYAEITEFDQLPENFEMERIEFFDTLPENLTFPMVQPYLVKKIEETIPGIKKQDTFEREYTRIDIIRGYVDRMLLESDDLENRRCGYVHLYGVGQAAAFIALHRGHDRKYAELAEIAGMLHDYITYQQGDRTDHAHRGAPVVEKILKETGEYTQEEITMISQAVYKHSDKDTIDSEFDEIIKDADEMQHWLRNPMENYWYQQKRVENLTKEMGFLL